MIKALAISSDHFILDTIKGNLNFIELITCNTPESCVVQIQALKPEIVFVDQDVLENLKVRFIESTGRLVYELILVQRNNGTDQLSFRNFLNDSGNTTNLQAVIVKSLQRLMERSVVSRLATFLDNCWSLKSTGKLAFPVGAGLEFIVVGDIFYGRAEGNYTRLFFEEGHTLFVSNMIKELESMLAPFGFFRIHNSYIANLQKVVRYNKGDGGEIEFVSGARLPVSRSRKEAFLERVQGKVA